MVRERGNREAFGHPGIPPKWAHSNKQGVGTAYSADSRVWYTLWRGILTEVYYPSVDRPQIRDLQLLFSDGETFFHEEKRDLVPRVERLTRSSLGFRVRSVAPENRYRLVKEVIGHPHLPCVLQRVRVEAASELLSRLAVYVLCAPHLELGGWHNNARVLETAGRSILSAEKETVALALAGSSPFSRLSCGFVGVSDGWTDLADNFRMDWEFDRATDGNVALTGQVAPGATREFTLALAFGRGRASAVSTLLQALGRPYAPLRARFLEQWTRAGRGLMRLERSSGDGGRLFRASHSVLLAHEDKLFPGAFIASLAIPWGSDKGDEARGGYHLVWVRDLAHVASGLLATGDRETALRVLVYLAACQQPDGGFAQNFWLNGEPFWTGVQLDEVSYPILLAWRLARERALQAFDPYPMVRAAASYLIRHGPATDQERWEELSGYSPSTLAVNIAALLCAAEIARQRADPDTARFLEEYADFLEIHLESWTVTTEGTLVPGIPRHYIRIRPADSAEPQPAEHANSGLVRLPNLPPGESNAYPAKEIVDPGFLELVRYGIRAPDDPVIVDSVRVVDAVLRIDTPFGPCWHRYNHDGYGEHPDGTGYDGWGRGRAWPLLVGERAHYELASGRDPRPLLRAMERFASPTGLISEQVWDEVDRPEEHLHLGRPTESAMPLCWTHAEYLELLRSVRDGRVFDRIESVAERYARRPRGKDRPPVPEVWKRNRPATRVAPGATLRVLGDEPFRLRWSPDGWRTAEETESRRTALDIDFVDVPVPASGSATVRFTFYWLGRAAWEGRDFAVDVR